MSDTQMPAIGEYIDAVRDALADAGIDLDPTTRRGYGNPPTARIYTTHRRGDSTDPQSFRAAVEWDGNRGWSVGWFENTYGGGVVHDRVRFDLSVTPTPDMVAAAVTEWVGAEPGARDAGAAQPPVRELAAAIRAALTVPASATRGMAGHTEQEHLLAMRAVHVRGALAALTGGFGALEDVLATVRRAAEWHPVTYETTTDPER